MTWFHKSLHLEKLPVDAGLKEHIMQINLFGLLEITITFMCQLSENNDDFKVNLKFWIEKLLQKIEQQLNKIQTKIQKV